MRSEGVKAKLALGKIQLAIGSWQLAMGITLIFNLNSVLVMN